MKHQVVAAIFGVLVCDAKYQGSIHRNWVGLLLFALLVLFTPYQFSFFCQILFLLQDCSVPFPNKVTLRVLISLFPPPQHPITAKWLS